MTKQYQRKESGLYVPSIQVPKARVKKKPWFVGLDPEDVMPKPFAGMMRPAIARFSRRKCCCEEDSSSSSSSDSSSDSSSSGPYNTCAGCITDTAGASYIVTPQNLTANLCAVPGGCDSLNGLSFEVIYNPGFPNTCRWASVGLSTGCGTAFCFLSAGYDVGTDTSNESVRILIFGTLICFSRDFPSQIDCRTALYGIVPQIFSAPATACSSTIQACAGAGAQCLVT